MIVLRLKNLKKFKTYAKILKRTAKLIPSLSDNHLSAVQPFHLVSLGWGDIGQTGHMIKYLVLKFSLHIVNALR